MKFCDPRDILAPPDCVVCVALAVLHATHLYIHKYQFINPLYHLNLTSLIHKLLTLTYIMVPQKFSAKMNLNPCIPVGFPEVMNLDEFKRVCEVTEGQTFHVMTRLAALLSTEDQVRQRFYQRSLLDR